MYIFVNKSLRKKICFFTFDIFSRSATLFYCEISPEVKIRSKLRWITMINTINVCFPVIFANSIFYDSPV